MASGITGALASMFKDNKQFAVANAVVQTLSGVANAIGTGVADDKSIYPYVPEMIRFYLGEEPILQNVPTWMCRKPDDLGYVLDHLHELVVKEVHGAGGYGMLIGPAATRAEIEAADAVDGTARRRLPNSPAAGFAHVKTGTLNDVRSLACYVLARNGHRYAVVLMINHPNADAARDAQDALLEWVAGL